MKFEELLEDSEVTEVIFYEGSSHLIVEKNGKLKNFVTSCDLEGFSHQIISALPTAPSYERPMCSGFWRGFRVQIVSPPAIDQTCFQLRKLSDLKSFLSFEPEKWGQNKSLKKLLQEKIEVKKENFLIVGPTGCGKTTLLKSFLHDFCKEDRVICLEDCPELPKVNELSCNLKTYTSSSADIPDVHLQDLLKASLRLRPDRLVMGEMRGKEASDFLLMLSTGHSGSAATLHAKSARDALLRLEMLVQMGKPWSKSITRSLIFSSLQFVITLKRSRSGKRTLSSVTEITGLEETGFLLQDLNLNSATTPPEAFEF